MDRNTAFHLNLPILPDFQIDHVLAEEPEEFALPATPPSSSSATSTPNEPVRTISEQNANGEQTDTNTETEASRFDYVVDPNYGVEV